MSDPEAALEEIRIVRKMIEATRQRVRGAWIPFLVFGVLGVLASLASHALQAEGGVWRAVPWLAFLALSLAGLRALRPHLGGGGTFVGRMLISTWRGVALAVLVLWIAVAGSASAALVGTLSLLGLGVFLSGRLLDYPPLTWGAGLWWLGAVLAAARPELAMLIEATVIALTYLLPAWGLYRQEVQGAHAA